MIIPKEHQLLFADKCWDILKEVGYVYLAGKPRSGKTYTAILTAEKSDKINSVLVLTKKAAIEGWHKFTVDNLILKHNYYVTNYEQAHKLNPEDYDLVIIDESHNLGKLGPPSKRIQVIRKLCWNMPHIHLSGTAIVESPCGIYAQMAISEYNPFPYKNFYEFFRQYGEPYYIQVGGSDINQYDKAKDSLLPIINEFTVYMTQEDAGISSDMQAEDELHYIDLEPPTKELYNRLQELNFADLSQNMFKACGDELTKTLVCDSTMKLRTSLHMIESGVAKISEPYIDDKDKERVRETYYDLGNNEKINYILEKFGDTKGLGIMCHFIGEQQKLVKYFKNATIYSSTSHAEGVDLSHLDHFVILSNNYSGAKFIQRKERIINMEGSNTLKVHHILVKKAISDQVYKRTSKKDDFNNSTYEQTSL